MVAASKYVHAYFASTWPDITTHHASAPVRTVPESPAPFRACLAATPCLAAAGPRQCQSARQSTTPLQSARGSFSQSAPSDFGMGNPSTYHAQGNEDERAKYCYRHVDDVLFRLGRLGRLLGLLLRRQRGLRVIDCRAQLERPCCLRGVYAFNELFHLLRRCVSHVSVHQNTFVSAYHLTLPHAMLTSKKVGCVGLFFL